MQNSSAAKRERLKRVSWFGTFRTLNDWFTLSALKQLLFEQDKAANLLAALNGCQHHSARPCEKVSLFECSALVIMDAMKSPNSNRKLLLVLAGILLVPIVPFLLMGIWFEPWLENMFSGSTFGSHPTIAFSVTALVLAVDILLPIPSSAVCTFAGKELGAISGTIACWIGLNLSAGIGYGIGNVCGRPLALRFSDAATLERLETLDNRSSVVCLLLCRSLPIVAEASVLLMGMKKLPQALFWPAVLLSNLGIAAALCWLGAVSAKANWFPLALGISLAIPLLFILYWKSKS